jgi:hypothetical protein
MSGEQKARYLADPCSSGTLQWPTLTEQKHR